MWGSRVRIPSSPPEKDWNFDTRFQSFSFCSCKNLLQNGKCTRDYELFSPSSFAAIAAAKSACKPLGQNAPTFLFGCITKRLLGFRCNNRAFVLLLGANGGNSEKTPLFNSLYFLWRLRNSAFLVIRQHRIIRQGSSARDFVPVQSSKATPHNGSCGLRRIFCPNRAV